MEAIHYVMAAGMAAWAGIGLYIFILGKRQNALAQRLNQLEALQEAPHDR